MIEIKLALLVLVHLVLIFLIVAFILYKIKSLRHTVKEFPGLIMLILTGVITYLFIHEKIKGHFEINDYLLLFDMNFLQQSIYIFTRLIYGLSVFVSFFSGLFILTMLLFLALDSFGMNTLKQQYKNEYNDNENHKIGYIFMISYLTAFMSLIILTFVNFIYSSY